MLDFTVSTAERRRWRLDLRSCLLGALIAAAPLLLVEPAGAFDLGGITKSVTRLASIKKNLDGDVKDLTADAKILISDKDKLLLIKDQLMKLASDTRSQIDGISALVGVVEGHLKQTQTNIAETSAHVGEIDAVRKALSK